MVADRDPRLRCVEVKSMVADRDPVLLRCIAVESIVVALSPKVVEWKINCGDSKFVFAIVPTCLSLTVTIRMTR